MHGAGCHNPCIVFADSPGGSSASRASETEKKSEVEQRQRTRRVTRPGGGRKRFRGGGVGDSRISDGKRRQQGMARDRGREREEVGR